MRKIGFFGGIGFFLVFLLSNLFAYQQKQALDNRKGAIIISPSVNIKKTPAKTSTDQFVLHEGTRVDIIDKGMTDWRGIRVGDLLQQGTLFLFLQVREFHRRSERNAPFINQIQKLRNELCKTNIAEHLSFTV